MIYWSLGGGKLDCAHSGKAALPVSCFNAWQESNNFLRRSMPLYAGAISLYNLFYGLFTHH